MQKSKWSVTEHPNKFGFYYGIRCTNPTGYELYYAQQWCAENGYAIHIHANEDQDYLDFVIYTQPDKSRLKQE